MCTVGYRFADAQMLKEEPAGSAHESPDEDGWGLS